MTLAAAAGPAPLHRRVADALRADVRSGRPAPGESLPPESELAARFGVSRGTVRQALGALRAEGLIAGGRGAPPVVRQPQLAQPFAELLSFSAWVASMGMTPSGRVVECRRRRASPALADRLEVASGAETLRLVRVRLADGEPLMIERTDSAPAAPSLVGAVDLEHASIYATLAVRSVLFASAHQTIDAVAASASDAELLEVRRGAPLLRLRRRSRSTQGTVLEWSEDRY